MFKNPARTVLLVLFASTLTIIALTFAQKASAAINKSFSYQGQLKNSSTGMAITSSDASCIISGDNNDTCDFRMSFYTAAAGGTLVWQEIEGDVEFNSDGSFSVSLDCAGNFDSCNQNGGPDFDSSDLYIEVAFAPAGDSNFTEVFSPRRQFTSVPYSFNADSVDGVNIATTTSNPEGSIIGSVGDMALDTSSSIMYIKTSGENTNTGWTAAGGGASTFLGLSDTPSSFTSGSILFTSGSAVTEDNSNLFWDDTNNSLGIGTTTPTSFKLEVAGDVGPAADSSYDLGSTTRRWRDIYVAPGTIHMGTNTDEAKIGYNVTLQRMEFDANGDGISDLTIYDDGRIGIGIEDPLAPIHIAAGGQVMRLDAKLRVFSDQAILPAPSSAPVDGDFANSQWSLWVDETNDEFEFKAKKSDGTVITQTIFDTLSGLTDTNISGIASGNILIYDGTNSWDNKALSGDATIAADGTLTIADNILDFTELSDSLSLDASTTLSAGTNNFIINLDSTGDFFIQDAGVPMATFQDNGDLVLANNLFVGSGTETISHGAFALNGDDLFVAGSLGIEGGIYTDGTFTFASNGMFDQTGSTIRILNTAGADLYLNSTYAEINSNYLYVPNLESFGDLGIGTSSDTLSLTLGRSDTTTIINSSNVGIGTTSPSSTLDIYGSMKVEESVGTILDIASNSEFIYNFGKGNYFNLQVGVNTDDAEENLGSGSVSTAGNDLELVTDGATSQEVGIRFQNLAIPQGATITNAYITFTAKTIDTGVTNLNFYGEAADNAVTFSTTTYDITSRTKTTASVTWSSVPGWNTIDEEHQTPDLTAAIQEVVNRAGWSSGNALVFIVTGSGERTAYSYATSSSDKAPKLHVEFTIYSSYVDASYTINNLGPGVFKVNDIASDTTPFMIDKDGNVGIGTTSPSRKLTLVDNGDTLSFSHDGSTALFESWGDFLLKNISLTNASTYVTIEGSGQGDAKLKIKDGQYGGTYTSLTQNNQTFEIDYGSSGTVTTLFNINPDGQDVDVQFEGMVDANLLFLDVANNNLGIGTGTPTSKFHLEGAVTGKALAIFNETGDQDIFTASASGTPKFVIDNSGNVGIGTTTPTNKLHVYAAGFSPIVSERSSSSTGSSLRGLELHRFTTGTATSGIGTEISFRAEDDSGNLETAAVISGILTDVSSTSEEGALVFEVVSDSTSIEAMRIQGVSGGSANVGIGTSSPKSILHTKISSGDNRFIMQSGGSDEAIFDLVSGGTGTRFFYRDSDDTFGIWHDATWTEATGVLSGGTTRFRIKSDGTIILNEGGGKVGVGAITPDGFFHLEASGLDATDIADVGQYALIIHDKNGANDKEVGIGFSMFPSGAVVDATDAPGAAITHERTGGWSAGKLHFKTRSSTLESGNPVTRMTIDEDGKVGIGTTSPSQLLHVSRSDDGVVARFTDSNGDCDINPTNTALICASDIRLKENVVTLEGSLDKILSLRGVSYNWISDETKTGKIGFIGQEIETVFPELVSINENGYMGVSYAGFTPVLVQAIKELDEKVVQLDSSLVLTSDELGEVLGGAEETSYVLTDELEEVRTELEKELGVVGYWNYQIWEFIEEVIFTKSVKFLADVVFSGPVRFEEQIEVGSDTAGQAVIPAGEGSVRVNFDKAYKNPPIVNLTPVGKLELGYSLEEVSKESFVISMETAQDKDTVFNWLAVETNGEAGIEESVGVEEIVIVETPEINDEENSSEIRILPSELDLVRVREMSTTASEQIGQVLPGEVYLFDEIIGEDSLPGGISWYHLEYEEGEWGWVSGTYIEEID